MGPRKKLNNAIARWHSNARPVRNDLEQAYADRMEAEMQEMAIQLHKVCYLFSHWLKNDAFFSRWVSRRLIGRFDARCSQRAYLGKWSISRLKMNAFYWRTFFCGSEHTKRVAFAGACVDNAQIDQWSISAS